MNDLDFVTELRAGVPDAPSDRLAVGRARLTAAIRAGTSPAPARSARMRSEARKLGAYARGAQPGGIMARGRGWQRRRLAALSVAGAAVVVALGVSALIGSGGSAPGGPVRLTAFTVVSSADGTVTVSIHRLVDPGALRQALAAHGVPALVTSGSFCTSDPEPSGFSQVVLPEPKPLDPMAILVIDPAAMPPGAELSVGYFGGQVQQASVVLISQGAYTCSGVRPTGPPPGQGRMYITWR